MNPCSGETSAWSSTFEFYLLLDPSKLVPGDANGDGSLNLVDLIYLVEYFFRSGLPPTPAQNGDVNCDDKCAVGDLIYLINYLFKLGPPPCKPSFKPLSLKQLAPTSQQMSK
ncbi:MAG TPA: dockerin type I repeat-containing protein [Terriglobales bacterium]|nr:dockerin type I repeat-containing protein [Terriglobales bacterium]